MTARSRDSAALCCGVSSRFPAPGRPPCACSPIAPRTRATSACTWFQSRPPVSAHVRGHCSGPCSEQAAARSSSQRRVRTSGRTLPPASPSPRSARACSTRAPRPAASSASPCPAMTAAATAPRAGEGTQTYRSGASSPADA
ncbi:hypothetical protein [Actinomadura madurae]|uniref:hypothetical protein n=1 Tax=Actinomadura madurae TaxID=1993 RepID=UPI0020D25E9C|nr:hypothetical protein [Actinomadura madurae]MCQ0009823.1 hypothetical protein [Actinomadura madurae]